MARNNSLSTRRKPVRHDFFTVSIACCFILLLSINQLSTSEKCKNFHILYCEIFTIESANTFVCVCVCWYDREFPVRFSWTLYTFAVIYLFIEQAQSFCLNWGQKFITLHLFPLPSSVSVRTHVFLKKHFTLQTHSLDNDVLPLFMNSLSQGVMHIWHLLMQILKN